ncbi:MAG: YciI family protein [Ignavibacteriaceae bacterium]|nr:YciI family protein [Ignavibacteriaceae bacterium]
MKHFIVLINYIAPLEQIEATTPVHREFLKHGYEKGFLLFSGPRVPRTGGLVCAKGETLEEVDSFFMNDPYRKNNLADYEFIQFRPLNKQQFLTGWLEEIE